MTNADSLRTNSRRIFFALWPDQKVRTEIYRVFRQSSQFTYPGRHLAINNLHLTLHFLGNVSEQKFECVSDVAKKVKQGKFQLRLDHFGSFNKAGVFWDGLSVVPDSLSKLHLQLGHLLTKCDYYPEARSFRPHVTLMRKYKPREVLIPHEAVEWTVDQFALVESISVEGGVEYRPLKFYGLV